MATKNSEKLWTIAELADRVQVALAKNFDGVANGRTRDVPDLRAIRYYTTLGLLDRPAEMRGRTAYYGRRHLCQLAAIKRLQADGLSLADVQSRLLGIGPRELERLADLPEKISGSVTKESGLARERAESADMATLVSPASRSLSDAEERIAEFWKQTPQSEPAANGDKVSSSPVADVWALVAVADGLSLGFAAQRQISSEDLDALRQAAGPLRQVLIQRGLIGSE